MADKPDRSNVTFSTRNAPAEYQDHLLAMDNRKSVNPVPPDQRPVLSPLASANRQLAGDLPPSRTEYLMQLAIKDAVIPLPRGVPAQAPAEAIPLNWRAPAIGIDETAKGTATKPVLSTMGFEMMSDRPDTPGAGPMAEAMRQAARNAGIPLGHNVLPSHARGQAIVCFYENAKTRKIHIRITEPANRLQAVDRPATDADRAQYRKQWEAFAGLLDQVNHDQGTPLDRLYKQQPSLIKQLESEGIDTVERLANLCDTGIEQIAPLGGIDLVKQANRFLETAPMREKDEKIAAMDEEISKLKAANEALMAARPAVEVIPPPRKRKEP